MKSDQSCALEGISHRFDLFIGQLGGELADHAFDAVLDPGTGNTVRRGDVIGDLNDGAVVIAVDVVQQAHDSPRAALMASICCCLSCFSSCREAVFRRMSLSIASRPSSRVSRCSSNEPGNAPSDAAGALLSGV